MGTTYQNILDAVESYYGSGSDQWVEIAKYGLTGSNAYEILRQVPGVNLVTNADGSIRSWTYESNVNWGSDNNIGSMPNSNSQNPVTGTTSRLNIPAHITGTSATGQFEMSSAIGLRKSTGTTVTGVLGTIGVASMAVAAGAFMGKAIDSTLYNLNPDFWDSHGMGSLDPDTWAGLVYDTPLADTALGAALFGVDGDNTTMYMDENMLAYMAWYLNTKGIFNESYYRSDIDDSIQKVFPNVDIRSTFFGSSAVYFTVAGSVSEGLYKDNESTVYLGFGKDYRNEGRLYVCSLKPFKFTNTPSLPNYFNASKYTINGKTYYYSSSPALQYGGTDDSRYSPPRGEIYNKINKRLECIPEIWGYCVLYGNTVKVGGVDGAYDAPNSTQFNPNGVGDVKSALDALRNQYPDAFNNAITTTVPQEDGSEKTYVYIPVPIPNFNGLADNKPTTDTEGSTQKDPNVNPDKTPQESLDDIADIMGKPPIKNDDPNTGGGNTPAITPTTQSASALWAIYNPSLAELNQLGAWLWSDNFLDQIKKIFNDPMQAIIGLHKIYVPPSISGSRNIKVGYLDTGVNSKVVGNQYTYIDCGSVSLREYYGNVLDYSPYTEVRLYLPFIGIVPLDVADVTRSTISVRYGVDVLTGACIANVSVQRDNAGGVLYSYTGNCAAQYPLSSGSYLGMLSGAFSAIGSLATGNIIGAVGGTMSMRTRVEHSGNFTGNAGAMGIKIPYLIVSRPQSAMNDGFPAIQGYPSNSFTQLKKCRGYVQVKDCHVENISATDKELDEIKGLLIQGVII